MQIVLGSKLSDLPDPLHSPHVWETFWLRWEGQWKGLVKQFVAKATASEKGFVAACARAGIAVGAKTDEAVEREWLCGLCGMCFATGGALGTHQSRAHGVQCPLREKVLGSVCDFCGKDFHARARLRTHLKYGADFCVRSAATLPTLDPGIVEAENARERTEAKSAKARGEHLLRGPPARRLVHPWAEGPQDELPV